MFTNEATATIEYKLEAINDLLKYNRITLDIEYILTQDHTCFDDLYKALDENGLLDVEVIYYSSAMEYLSEYDPSLRESMILAQDYGYTPESIDSELLASVLATENLRNGFSALSSEIDVILEG